MELMHQKRGFLFTLLVIVALSLFFLSYSLFSTYNRNEPLHQRVTTLDNFVHSLDVDLPRQVYISGFRALFLMEKDILENGRYVDDVDTRFNELFYNGTLYTVPKNEMIGAQYSDIAQALSVKASKINAQATLINPTVSISQTSPWEVTFTFTARLIVNDSKGLVAWDRTSSYVAKVPVSHFADPLYVINTNGLVVPKVVESPYVLFVNGTNVASLNDHLSNGYYLPSSDGPSFLSRLKGSTSGDAQGIESIVNGAHLSSQGISLQQKSMVDHIYFSSSNPSSCLVLPAGTPSWFRLDASHVGRYNVSCAP